MFALYLPQSPIRWHFLLAFETVSIVRRFRSWRYGLFREGCTTKKLELDGSWEAGLLSVSVYY
jgi:hypothetical protein